MTFFHAAFKESISDEERRDLTVAAALTSMGGLYTARAIASSPLRQKKERRGKKKIRTRGSCRNPFSLSPLEEREFGGRYWAEIRRGRRAPSI